MADKTKNVEKIPVVSGFAPKSLKTNLAFFVISGATIKHRNIPVIPIKYANKPVMLSSFRFLIFPDLFN